ncbi:hypothetical protein ABKW02_23635, partial [Enterobacter cloacae]
HTAVPPGWCVAFYFSGIASNTSVSSGILSPLSVTILPQEVDALAKQVDNVVVNSTLPIDTYKKDLDAIANAPLHLDWEAPGVKNIRQRFS